MRNLILCSVLFVAGFLAGFIPQYSRARRFEQEVSASTAQLEACRGAEQLSQLRDAGTLMYLEATQKNYGTSGDDASRFFNQAQSLANSTPDESLRNLLHEILAARDQITSDLAKGDAAVVSEMQPVLSKVEQTSKR
ncbi:MAG: hypothetical protein WA609_05665 [Terriglobales bacterium]